MIVQPLFLGILPPYSMILTASAVVGLGISAWLAEDRKKIVVDIGIGVLFICLVGSRLGYVIRNYAYFFDHAGQIPQFWLGGLAWPGAMFAAGAGLWGVSLIWKEPLGDLADSYLPLFGTVVVAIWLAGWGSGIGYGPATDAWFGIPVRDLFGIRDFRWPLPIIGAILSGGWITGAILFPLKKFRQPGFRAAVAVTGILFINGVISLFRVDPAPSLVGIRVETWISFIITILIVGAFFYRRKTVNDEKP